ncbi:MAG: tetratricopeptide repeat protein [Gemmatimonadota bacterium]|nr:tetratricopeptide repeat protein [Gemmatimonadota bacterium]
MNYLLRGKGLRTLPGLMLMVALAIPIAGCNTDKLVRVDDPSGVTPEGFNNPSAIPAVVAGAYRQFVGGYDGFGDDAFLSSSAVLTDEFYYGDTFTTRNAADHRNLQPTVLGNISDAAYSRLQQARTNARRAFATVTGASTAETATADDATKAQLRTIEAYTYVTLSEGWCGDVPFSMLPDTGAIDPTLIQYGRGLTTLEMNDTAIARYNQALALNPANNLTAVGEGRALLNEGRYAEAAALVQNVPTTYVFLIEHSVNQAAENNPSFALQDNGRYGVSNLEGGLTSTGAALRPDLATPPLTAPSAEGLPFRGLRDPRVPWQPRSSTFCFSSSVRCFIDNNYPTLDADVPLASGVEARLIEAEAALQADQPDVMLAKLNALRASVIPLLAALYPSQKQTFRDASGAIVLAPLTDPITLTMTAAEMFAARRDLLFRERALWLYNTGHRIGDLRRLVRNYGLPSNQVFPSGLHFRGGSYGNDVAYPVPFNEQNNPQFVPAACITTTA